MTTKKVITVIGGTGVQGGGLIQELLKQGGWNIRVITRNPDGPAAKQLRDQGVQIIAGNIDNKDDLTKAIAGADAVFSNTLTNYAQGPQEEEKQGKLIVDVAKEQNVKHFIYSSAVNGEIVTNGALKLAFFSCKAHVEEYMFKSGGHNGPRPNAEGSYEFGFPVNPDSKIPFGDPAELGKVAAIMFQKREEFLGKRILVAGDYLSPNELAAVYSKALKKPVKFNYTPRASFTPAGLGEMFEFFDRYGYIGEKVIPHDVFEGKKLAPELSTFEQYLAKHVTVKA